MKPFIKPKDDNKDYNPEIDMMLEDERLRLEDSMRDYLDEEDEFDADDLRDVL